MGTGQADAKMYQKALRDLIVAGPGFVVSKQVTLGEAPEAYERFDRREEGNSKVVLEPATVAWRECGCSC